jgi:hypothetical protein
MVKLEAVREYGTFELLDGCELLPWSSDIQKMADSVAQDGPTYTNRDRRRPIFWVPAVHIGVI